MCVEGGALGVAMARGSPAEGGVNHGWGKKCKREISIHEVSLSLCEISGGDHVFIRKVSVRSLVETMCSSGKSL